MSATEAKLYTIGHSNQPLDAFIALLKRHAIEVVSDARSAPYSKYVPQFNKEELEHALKDAGIKYIYMGRELGGRPDDDDCYDDDGRVLYYKLAEDATFLKGIERLETGIRRCRVALMCSEEDPAVCHRYLLVGRVMARRGAKMLHIRGDGRIDSDADLQDEQPLLFELPEEDSEWKSLRSVSRRNPRPSSSESSENMESSDSSMFD
jgi:uncharacterized protein (DUF488 family)